MITPATEAYDGIRTAAIDVELACGQIDTAARLAVSAGFTKRQQRTIEKARNAVTDAAHSLRRLQDDLSIIDPYDEAQR